MSIDAKPQKKPVWFDVLVEGSTGRVVAAYEARVRATGKNGPSTFHWTPKDGQTATRIVIGGDQLDLDLGKLFESHRVEEGKLVPECKD
ncbi:MAG: hypothetical protein AAFU73_19930 [Planctomycetota bacterium]